MPTQRKFAFKNNSKTKDVAAKRLDYRVELRRKKREQVLDAQRNLYKDPALDKELFDSSAASEADSSMEQHVQVMYADPLELARQELADVKRLRGADGSMQRLKPLLDAMDERVKLETVSLLMNLRDEIGGEVALDAMISNELLPLLVELLYLGSFATQRLVLYLLYDLVADAIPAQLESLRATGVLDAICTMLNSRDNNCIKLILDIFKIFIKHAGAGEQIGRDFVRSILSGPVHSRLETLFNECTNEKLSCAAAELLDTVDQVEGIAQTEDTQDVSMEPDAGCSHYSF